MILSILPILAIASMSPVPTGDPYYNTYALTGHYILRYDIETLSRDRDADLLTTCYVYGQLYANDTDNYLFTFTRFEVSSVNYHSGTPSTYNFVVYNDHPNETIDNVNQFQLRSQCDSDNDVFYSLYFDNVKVAYSEFYDFGYDFYLYDTYYTIDLTDGFTYDYYFNCLDKAINSVYADYNSGYHDGFSDGESSGYNHGWNDGFTEGASQDETAVVIFSGIVQVGLLPINFFLAMLNFEVFGINIGGLVSAFLTIAVVIIIIRVITGSGNGDKK